jgi:hypothetical protein
MVSLRPGEVKMKYPSGGLEIPVLRFATRASAPFAYDDGLNFGGKRVWAL